MWISVQSIHFIFATHTAFRLSALGRRNATLRPWWAPSHSTVLYSWSRLRCWHPGLHLGWEGGGASPCERSSHGLVSRTPHRALTSGDGHHQETDQGLPLCAQVLPTRGVPTPRFLCKSISADSPCGREKTGSSLVQVCAKPESPRVKQGAHVPLLSDL